MTGMDPARSAAIVMEEVVKVYRVPAPLPWKAGRRIQALRGVTLACPSRAVSCILGPNGAGKTTVLKILAGLVIADGGRVVLDGRTVEHGGDRMARTVGIATPNDRSFSLRLSGRQNLEFFGALHGLRGRERSGRIAEVMARADLDEETADKACMTYSSGMRQKLLIARALLARPPVLLLDEPTARLDPLARRGVHELIRTLVDQHGITVVLSTHDLSEAQALSDHLVLLHEGRTLAAGTLRDLRALLPPARRVVLEFEVPPRPGWQGDLPAGCSAGSDDHRVEISVQGGEHLIPDVIQAAVANGGRILSCTRAEVPLLDVFARVMEKAG